MMKWHKSAWNNLVNKTITTLFHLQPVILSHTRTNAHTHNPPTINSCNSFSVPITNLLVTRSGLSVYD